MKFNVYIPAQPTYGGLTSNTSTGKIEEVEGDDYYVDQEVLFVYTKATEGKPRTLKAAFRSWVWIKQVES